ncbi:MAG: hypothetical protein LBJ97_00920 [Mycoplasmataceae bacterium]|nr:hypothetical protein [Mycoplasmataceae bacterium]
MTKYNVHIEKRISADEFVVNANKVGTRLPKYVTRDEFNEFKKEINHIFVNKNDFEKFQDNINIKFNVLFDHLGIQTPTVIKK